MQYEIKAFNKQTGSALVRFWTEAYPDGLTYNIDIPVVSGAYLSGGALEDHIQSFAPTGQIARLVELAALDSSGIDALVTPEPPPPAKTPEQIKADQLAAIDKIKRDKLFGGFTYNGVSYHCDPVFQQQITSYVAGFESGITPADARVPVRTYDNVNTTMNYTELKAFATALMPYVTQIYMDSWTAKDAL